MINELSNVDLLEDEETVCRICLESSGEFGDECLRCRCHCKSAKYHDDCIMKWINIKKSKQCEICKIDFVGVRHGTVTRIFSETAKRLAATCVILAMIDGIMWYIYFTLDDPITCGLKDDKNNSRVLRDIYTTRCDRFNNDKMTLMVTIAMMTCVFGGIIISFIIFKEQMGMFETIYHNNFVIDKNVILARVDIPEHLDNVIIESENLRIEISPGTPDTPGTPGTPDTPGTPGTPINQNASNVLQNQDSMDSVVSI